MKHIKKLLLALIIIISNNIFSTPCDLTLEKNFRLVSETLKRKSLPYKYYQNEADYCLIRNKETEDNNGNKQKIPQAEKAIDLLKKIYETGSNIISEKAKDICHTKFLDILLEYGTQPTTRKHKSNFENIYTAIDFLIETLPSIKEATNKTQNIDAELIETLENINSLFHMKADYINIAINALIFLFLPQEPLNESNYNEFFINKTKIVTELKTVFGEKPWIKEATETFLNMLEPNISIANKIDIFKNQDYLHTRVNNYLKILEKKAIPESQSEDFKKDFLEIPFLVKYLPFEEFSKLFISDKRSNGNRFQRQLSYIMGYDVSMLKSNYAFYGLTMKMFETIHHLKEIDKNPNIKTELNRAINHSSSTFSQEVKDAIKVCIEAEYVYAVLAEVFGLSHIKKEISNITVKYLKPIKYNFVKEHLDKLFENGVLKSSTRQVVNKTKNELKDIADNFITKHNVEEKDISVKGRFKSTSSLVHKLEIGKPLSIIFDYYAFRIITEKPRTLYGILLNMLPQKGTKQDIPINLVMEVSKSLSNTKNNNTEITDIIINLAKNYNIQFDKSKIRNIKDYIQKPKPNGYQSLHASFEFNGQIIEVQLRTKTMHRYAEFGGADHNVYKGFAPVGDDGLASRFFNIIYGPIIQARKNTNDDLTTTEFKEVQQTIKFINFFFDYKNGYNFIEVNIDKKGLSNYTENYK